MNQNINRKSYNTAKFLGFFSIFTHPQIAQ